MADGTLTIYTETDEKGIKVGMKEIEASVKRMSSSVEGLGEKAKIALQKQLDSLSKLNNQYGQQEQKVEALRKRLKELSDQKIETEEYKRLGYSETMKKTWFCHTTVKGEPCGVCSPCRQTIEAGLSFRISRAGLERHEKELLERFLPTELHAKNS